jgi:ankyrin repeat protein
MKRLILLAIISFSIIGCSQHKYQLAMQGSDSKDIVSSAEESSDEEVFKKCVDLIDGGYLSIRLKDFFKEHEDRLEKKYFWQKNQYQDYYSFLEYAARAGNQEVVAYLIKQLKCDPTSTTGRLNRTLLHLAVIAGSLDLSKYLIETVGLDINQGDANGSLPIHYAIAGMKTGLAECLLKKGADIEKVDNDGFTILHIATLTGETDLVKLCVKYIQKHCDEAKAIEIVNLSTNSGNTALHIAASKCDGVAVDVLLSAGADKKLRTKRLNRYPYQIAEKRDKPIMAAKLKFNDKEEKQLK